LRVRTKSLSRKKRSENGSDTKYALNYQERREREVSQREKFADGRLAPGTAQQTPEGTTFSRKNTRNKGEAETGGKINRMEWGWEESACYGRETRIVRISFYHGRSSISEREKEIKPGGDK